MIFQGYLEEIKNDDSIKYRITKPPQGTKFKITHYSQVGIYTLIQYELEEEEEIRVGEYLYRDQTPIAIDEYLGLYEEQLISSTKTLQVIDFDIWKTVNPTLGSYGVPTHIARQLREKLIKF